MTDDDVLCGDIPFLTYMIFKLVICNSEKGSIITSSIPIDEEFISEFFPSLVPACQT
jgi:hypothetical protein